MPRLACPFVPSAFAPFVPLAPLVLAFAALGCHGSGATPRAPETAASPNAALPAPPPPAEDVPGSAAALLKPGALLMIGEWHGTEEVPDLVGKLAHEAAAKGPVTVHLESLQSEQARIDELFRQRGPAPAPQDGIWAAPYQYGVTSAAMCGSSSSPCAVFPRETGHVRLHLMDPGSPEKADAQ